MKKRSASTVEEFAADPKRAALLKEDTLKVMIAEMVVEGMERKGLTVRQLAQELDVSPTTIQSIRDVWGETYPSVMTMVRVLETLGYKVLVQDEEGQKKQSKARKKEVARA